MWRQSLKSGLNWPTARAVSRPPVFSLQNRFVRYEAETEKLIVRGLKRSLLMITFVGVFGVFFYERLKKNKFEGMIFFDHGN